MRLFVLSLLLVAAPASRAAEIPHIELARHGDDWRVTYLFETPVQELRFAREDAKGNRASTWRPVDDLAVLALEEGVEVARASDGKPFRQLAFEMAPRYMPLDKDYAPFSPFRDGGLLIHTGRFFACAPACGDDSVAWPFSIEPPRGSHVIHDGATSDERIDFVDRDSGTNVYVGTATPVETSHVVAVVDPEFPAEARKQLTELFPRLMDYYAQRLGALPHKPMLFASRDAKHPGGGQGHQGGTLPGQVFVHLYGPAPDGDPQAFADAMSAFFAHEAAHLYQRYEASREEDAAWLHEGGADAFALLALQDLGLLAAGQRESRTAQALAQCAAGLKGFALKDAGARGAFDDYYRCGMLMHLAVDAAARRQSAGSCDLFCVFRAVLDRVGAGADWSAETWYATVDEFAGKITGRFVREAAMQPHADPRRFFEGGLRDAGVATTQPR
jgi:hypothetical protein